jgi:hypothetical protein
LLRSLDLPAGLSAADPTSINDIPSLALRELWLHRNLQHDLRQGSAHLRLSQAILREEVEHEGPSGDALPNSGENSSYVSKFLGAFRHGMPRLRGLAAAASRALVGRTGEGYKPRGFAILLNQQRTI